MHLEQSPILKAYIDGVGFNKYDFYRCYHCRVIFTEEQLRARCRSAEKTGDSSICDCGSMKFVPAWPKRLQWARWNVLRYTLKLVLARGLAPWLDKHYPPALPLVERLVQPKEK